MKCIRCTVINADDVLFCRNCGILFHHDTNVECENHSGRDAVGICVVCGKPVCDYCMKTGEGKTYCDDAAHAQVPVTHAKLAAAVSEFGADLVVKNLVANGIAALVFSQHRYSHFYRFTDDAPASIFVRKEMAEAAHRLVEEMDLTDFLHQNNNTL
jgi:hypothetical protein